MSKKAIIAIIIVLILLFLFIIIGVALSASSSSSTQQTGNKFSFPTFEQLNDVNLVYGQIPSPGAEPAGYYYLGSQDSNLACQSACGAKNDCVAYTWHNQNAGDWAKQCYGIKRGTSYDRTPDSNKTSGVRKETFFLGPNKHNLDQEQMSGGNPYKGTVWDQKAWT